MCAFDSLNTAAFVWMIPFGLGSAIRSVIVVQFTLAKSFAFCLTSNPASSTRVSNELGAGRPQAARLAVRVVVLLAVSEGLAVGLILVCVRYVWGHAYSNVPEVVAYVAKMMLVIAVSNFFDGIQCVLSGAEFESFLS